MRRILLIVALLVAGAATVAASAGADDTHTYKIEMYNAHGIVPGSDMRVEGVIVGRVSEVDVNDRKRAVATVEISSDAAQLGERRRTEANRLVEGVGVAGEGGSELVDQQL